MGVGRAGIWVGVGGVRVGGSRGPSGSSSRAGWRGLDAHLSEMELGTGFPTLVHDFGQAVFGYEAVEDDDVDEDDEDFEDDFDDGADEAPVLQSTHQGVVDVAVEEFLAHVLAARPSPHVLVVAVGFGALVDARRHDPHDQIEAEEAHRQDRVVQGILLGQLVPAPEVPVEHHQAAHQRHARHAEHQPLGPRVCAFGPGGQVVARRQVLGGVEDGERRA